MERAGYPLGRWLADAGLRVNLRYDFTKAYGPVWRFGDILTDDALATVRATGVTYAPAAGAPDLRAAIAAHLNVDPALVTVTNGASEAIQLTLLDAAENGGTALIPSPSYPAFEPMAGAAGLAVAHYSLDREDEFQMCCEAILARVDATTRIVIVNSPHNPTGAVMAPDELQALSAELEQRGVRLLIDEVFWPLSPVRRSHAAFLPTAIVVGDLSKAFSLPGLRIGWMVASDPGVRARTRERRAWLSAGASPILERLAVSVLRQPQAFLERTRSSVLANLAALDDLVTASEGRMALVSPKGGVVAFPSIDVPDTEPFCRRLAEAGVLVLPGSIFGAAQHLRIGLGEEPADFRDGIRTIAALLASLPPWGAAPRTDPMTCCTMETEGAPPGSEPLERAGRVSGHFSSTESRRPCRS